MPSAEAVTDHGAVGDGETSETKALQSAVDAAADAGGGTVHVPSGTYRTGTVFLRSHVTLDLDAGATLLGSTDRTEYGAGSGPLSGLLVANDCENVAVVGDGTIDANGTAFMQMDTPLDPMDDPAIEGADYRPRQESAERFLRTEEVADGPVAVGDWRPDRTLVCYDAESIRLDGISVRDGPHWTVHFLGCRGVDVQGVDIRTDPRIPNSDGINPEHTSDVTVSNCTVYTGDDAISPKTNGDYDVGG
ncbi:MAG: glycoside hydrolase family 28 protein, partial [Halobacteriaceae archaeon]